MSFEIDCSSSGDCGLGCRQEKYNPDVCLGACCEKQKSYCKHDEDCMKDRKCQGIYSIKYISLKIISLRLSQFK